ncbi:glucose-1-phosphate cytidylyltransferase [Sulfurihydrogenibium azorense Az-Fu1]|uniref:Glucose-1-phosphate cytidylyltransferase n=1 Tax=Sulfurihydrogenibium azorense (strain DSM 15241 / OCM 825 / Az-Fu1) TaxID=204536 RepID=C1DVN7_SULAA|nr:glucose-1-phosphate cytidylyltransferase [Sulfurihydrogenibium azorense]ACN99039.1 glucose-1-phosphate cytidylyltransferase [Sulfurihydrogenibium azorense Az-Fu1]
MKVVILAGGFGTRLSEETDIKPKPMVEIGGKPILWHIMKIYSSYGFNDFIICLGYKGYIIKEFFANYFLYTSDVTIDLKDNKIEVHSVKAEPWKVTLVDTGLNTMTGGRIKRIKPFVENQTFMLTYGDGVGNIDIKKLLEFHKSHGKYATLTAVQPSGRFGALHLEGDKVKEFEEKPKGDGAWVNGGFFVLEPQIFDYIEGDETIWEKEPLENLAKDGQLMAYKHTGFWKPMDTLRDKRELELLWQSGNPPWKIWED